jgi:hypothetical protein
MSTRAYMQGYVFSELAKITHSDITACEKLAEAIGKVLAKSDPNLKWKALVLMKNVSKAGRPEFRRCLQRHNETVKACLQFKAPLDPLKGDEAGRRVREAAKDALEAMFDNSTTSASAGVGARITSYGSAPATGASGFPPVGPSTGPSAFPPVASTHKPIFGGLPGQAGFDPASPLHSPVITTGTMVRVRPE